MALSYLGNCNWEPVSLPDWTVDSWGVDRAKWTWTGRPSLLGAFRQTLAGFKTLPAFGAVVPANAGVRLLDYTENHSSRPHLPTIEFSFAGFRSGRIPPAKATNSTSSQTAQGEGVDTATGDNVSGTILYLASRTTWEWFETSKPDPKLPRYSAVQDPLNPFNNIRRVSISRSDDGTPIHTVPYSSFAAVFNSLVTTTILSDYTRVPILPDALWACSSTVDYVLQ